MLRIFLIVGLLLSVVFVSGCLEQMTDTGAGEAQLEDQAAETIEQEMEDAIEGITLEDIEDLIIE